MADGPRFLPGVELSGALYTEAVAPLLRERFPRLSYSAGRVGPGSDVLGFDTPRSTDHDWGPRLTLFLSEVDAESVGAELDAALSSGLPERIRGWPTGFAGSGSTVLGTLSFDPAVPARHGVEVTTVRRWLRDRLGSDVVLGGEPGPVDWLSMPQQRLGEVVGGAVFHDGLGTLARVRDRLSWYPDDVWRYLLACQWTKLSQEEPFVGRTAEVSDVVGSVLVAARQAREAWRLALLMARRYAPYSKWLGSAVARDVPDAGRVSDPLAAALSADDPVTRQEWLCVAYTELAERHNALGLTAPLSTRARRFHDRPFPVLDAWRFADALRETVRDRRLRAAPLVGAVDQWADNTDLTSRPGDCRAAVAAWWGQGLS